MTDRPPLLTDAEHDLVNRLGDWWVDLCAVAGPAPTRQADLAELAVHLHALQNAVLAQAAARAYPDHYRALGWSLHSFSDNPRPYVLDAADDDDGQRPPEQEEPHEYVPQGPTDHPADRSCQTCGGDLREPGTNHTNLDAASQRRYQALVADGMSQHEAQETVWPTDG